MSPPALSGCQGIQEIYAMKRKLKLSRETLLHLEGKDLQEVAGGNASTIFTRCGSCNLTCNYSCLGTCQFTACIAC
jgi:hypothetical protein